MSTEPKMTTMLLRDSTVRRPTLSAMPPPNRPPIMPPTGNMAITSAHTDDWSTPWERVATRRCAPFVPARRVRERRGVGTAAWALVRTVKAVDKARRPLGVAEAARADDLLRDVHDAAVVPKLEGTQQRECDRPPEAPRQLRGPLCAAAAAATCVRVRLHVRAEA